MTKAFGIGIMVGCLIGWTEAYFSKGVFPNPLNYAIAIFGAVLFIGGSCKSN